MKGEILSEIFELRLSVGFLMEKHQWWQTQFFSESSSEMLSYAFPKTANSNLNFYLEPIRQMVDNKVGANYYHLFRLPIQIEEQLYKKSAESTDLLKINEDSAISILRAISAELSIDKSEGPINVGQSENLVFETIQAIAAHYLSAFENNYKVHPYLN